MSLLIPHVYYRIRCRVCGMKVETRDVQYEKCPKCGSHSVDSARAERMEAYDSDRNDQESVNESVERALRRLPS